LWLMFLNFDSIAPGQDIPANAILVADEPAITGAVDTVQRVIGVSAIVLLAVLLVRRYRRASPPLRRVLTPVLAGARAMVIFAVAYPREKFAVAPALLSNSTLLVRSAVPLIFLVGLLRARLARSAIGDLLVDLREPAAPGRLRDALARALR